MFDIGLHGTDPMLMKVEAHQVESGTTWLSIDMREDKDRSKDDYQRTAGKIVIFMDDYGLATRIADAVTGAIADHKAESELPRMTEEELLRGLEDICPPCGGKVGSFQEDAP